MMSLGHVALDGNKVQANASRRRAMSHERMLEAEAQLEREIQAPAAPPTIQNHLISRSIDLTAAPAPLGKAPWLNNKDPGTRS